MTQATPKPKIPLPHTYELAHPIQVLANGQLSHHITVAEIKRRPRLKDLKAVAAGADKLTQNQIAIERLTGLPRVQVEELDIVDYQALVEILFPYFMVAEGSEESSADVPDES